jgi:hypothetical protein
MSFWGFFSNNLVKCALFSHPIILGGCYIINDLCPVINIPFYLSFLSLIARLHVSLVGFWWPVLFIVFLCSSHVQFSLMNKRIKHYSDYSMLLYKTTFPKARFIRYVSMGRTKHYYLALLKSILVPGWSHDWWGNMSPVSPSFHFKQQFGELHVSTWWM